MELKDALEELEKQRDDIKEEFEGFREATKAGDSAKAWNMLARTLGKSNKSLKLVSGMMPLLRKTLEDRGVKLEDDLEKPKKKIQKMIVIPRQTKII